MSLLAGRGAIYGFSHVKGGKEAGEQGLDYEKENTKGFVREREDFDILQ